MLYSLDHCIYVLPWISFVLTEPVHRNPEYLSLPTGSKLVTPQSFSFWCNRFPLVTLIFIILFYFISNRMGAWSDAFIHFVCGSRRVNIRLGVLLLIPKSPHISIFRAPNHTHTHTLMLVWTYTLFTLHVTKKNEFKSLFPEFINLNIIV